MTKMDKPRIKEQGIVRHFELKYTNTCVSSNKVGQGIYLIPYQIRPEQSVKLFL